jgi:hypothetical protein
LEEEKMKTRLVLIALAFASCGLAQDVEYNFDKNADFSKYKTYMWKEHPKSVGVDQLAKKSYAAAFDAELALKGLQRITEGTPDLVIVYQVAVSSQQEITTYSSGYGYGPGWGPGYYRGGGWYGGPSTSTTNVTTLKVGSVALDMYDSATKTVVWRGIGSQKIEKKSDPNKIDKNARKIAEKMLRKNYPPKIKK